ncbi:MAG TPA: hypothetical protein VIX37_11565 [Candidatus Sulfotelmatobacter sp.]
MPFNKPGGKPTPTPPIAPPAPVTAATYVPQFSDDVSQKFMTGLTSPINPSLCLTTESANQLAVILADLHPAIVQADPYPVVAGSMAFTSLVPWFKFASGAAVNCGQQGMYWVSAPDGHAADLRCRQDIAAAEALYEKEGDAQYPAQLRADYVPPAPTPHK